MQKVDAKKMGKVAVLCGGISAEREVSLKSGSLVLQALQDYGVQAMDFDPAQLSIFELKTEGVDRVFNALHGGYGENGQIQGALDFLAIPYTGCGVLASALSMDKYRSKLIWQQLNIPTPLFLTVVRGEDYQQAAQRIIDTLGLPVFVKPASEGSSIAVFKVKTQDALPQVLAQAAQHDAVVLIEKSIEGGGEYTATILGNRVLPLIKIEPKTEFYDYNAKYIANDTRYLIPSGLSAKQEAEMMQLSQKAAHALGCEGWGRVDLMMDCEGQAYCLEVNTAPGMTDHSLSPKAAQALGMSYTDLILAVLDLTFKV